MTAISVTVELPSPVEVSVCVVRALVRLREMLASNAEFARKLE